MSITHSKVSGETNPVDGRVGGEDWDAAHVIGDGTVTEAKLSIADNTTGNVSTSAHGFAPKGDGDTTKFLNANGAYSVPTSPGAGATLVGASTASAASPLVITKPVGTANGDLLIFVVQTTNSVPDINGPDGTGWTTQLRYETGSGEWQAVYTKVASSEGASWSRIS